MKKIAITLIIGLTITACDTKDYCEYSDIALEKYYEAKAKEDDSSAKIWGDIYERDYEKCMEKTYN